jgi:hypothetical protein
MTHFVAVRPDVTGAPLRGKQPDAHFEDAGFRRERTEVSQRPRGRNQGGFFPKLPQSRDERGFPLVNEPADDFPAIITERMAEDPDEAEFILQDWQNSDTGHPVCGLVMRHDGEIVGNLIARRIPDMVEIDGENGIPADLSSGQQGDRDIGHGG